MARRAPILKLAGPGAGNALGRACSAQRAIPARWQRLEQDTGSPPFFVDGNPTI